MFNNVKAKKRLTQLIVAFVVICMSVTGSFLLLDDAIDSADAATYNASVNSVDSWNAAVNKSNGDTVNITLTGSFDAGKKLNAIPAGVTVNLNMSGNSITWDTQESNTTNIMDTNYSDGIRTDFWGLITNNGTLNIAAGSGTIRMKKINYNYKNTSKKDQFATKSAAIVNNGTMTVGAGIVIENYTAMCGTERSGSGNYMDNFVYGCAIYNASGKLTTSGTISAGSMATSVGVSGSNSYAYAFSYGIYGGDVVTKGGTINSVAYSGGMDTSGTCTTGSQIVAIGVGIYSNNAQILGDTKIDSTTTTWMSNTSNNCWGGDGGIDVSVSVGVLYVNTNYPVIGASVDIDSKFFCTAGSEMTLAIPGAPELYYGSLRNADNPRDYARRAYPIAGAAKVQNTIGDHKSEMNWKDGDYFGVPSSGSNDVENNFNMNTNMFYYPEEAYFGNDNVTTSLAVNANSQFKRETNTNDWQEAIGSFRNGVPGTAGTQFKVIYRYFEGSFDTSKLMEASPKADNRLKSKAIVAVGGNNNQTGAMTDASASASLASGSGASQNERYYSFAGATYEKVPTSDFASRSYTNKGHWSTKGSTFGQNVTMTSENTLVVYMNYVKQDPSAIRIVASNGSIDKYTTTTSFSVTYTGNTLVPGTDFKLGIIDLGIDKDISTNNPENDTVVTDVYDISGNGAGSGNNATAVKYRYSTDNTNWTPGLPKDVGEYWIEVEVYADVTYATSGTYNRQAKTSVIKGVITKANISITGDEIKNGVYGTKYADLIPFSTYTAKGLGSDAIEGSWSYAGLDANAYPAAGQYTVFLAWTPAAGTKTANNYNSTTFPVTLNVAVRDVEVSAGNSTVTYGDAKPSFVPSYTNLADCDNAKRTEWANNTTYEIYYDNQWITYTAGIPAGTYAARITSFGGAEDLNNNFKQPYTEGTLTVAPRSIVYNAVATDRAYNGLDTVEVKLNYVSGNFSNDTYDSVITTTGKMADANAADGKHVTVDVTGIKIQNSANYKLSIYNNDNILVNIAKADPTGVSAVADPAVVTYDSDATLADINLKETNAIEGSWSWKNAEINPTVDVATYVAVFTPADQVNYNTIEKNVILTVNQKEVKVTVSDFTIAYGDGIPAISGSIKYDGLGSDTIGSIGASGNVDVTTTYTKGSPVGEYPVNVVSTLTSTNYYFTAVNNKIVVTPKTLKVTAVDQSVTYGGAAPEFDVSDLKFDGFYGTENYTNLDGTVEIKTAYVPGADVGAYAITVSGYSSSNYAIEYVAGTLTVNKAVLTVTPINVTGVTYGADAPKYAENNYYKFTGFVAGDTEDTVAIEGKPAFTTGYESGKDAGTYPVTVTVNNLEAKNYSFVGSEGSLIVGKATPVVSGAPGVTVVNSHKYSTAIFDGTETVVNPNKATITVAGKFTLQNADTVATYDNQYVDTVAVFTPYDTINYDATTTAVVLEVLAKNVSGKPVIQGSAMENKTLTLNLSAMDPADASCYTIQWYADGAAIAGAYGTSYTIKSSDIGKTFHVVVTANENQGFIGTVPTDPTSAVIKALLETTAAQFKHNIADVEYDALSHGVSVSLADGYDAQYFGNTVTVKYNGVTTAPTAAGKYTVTVDINAPAEPAGGYDSSKHYGPATGIVLGVLEITPAPLKVIINVSDKVYDGTKIAYATVSPLVLKDEDDIVNVAPGCQFAFKDDANVGTDKEVIVTSLDLVGEDAGNYYIVEEISTASITPRTLTAKVANTTKVYDGSTTVPVTFLNVTGRASTDSSSSVYLINGIANAMSADAGTWKFADVTCELAGPQKDNYVVEFTDVASAEVVITPATPNVQAPTLYGITYDAGVTLNELNYLLTSYSTEDGFWQFNNLTTVPTVKQTAYAATYVSTNKNYSSTVADVTIHVEPLAVTLYPIDATVTYGTKAPVIKVGPEVLPDGTPLTEIGGSCTAVHSYRAGASIGSYEIKLNNALSDDNYDFTTGTGTLTVVPATINVAASAVNKVYDGTSDVTVKFDIVSGKYNNDDVDVNVKSTIGQTATPNAGTTTVSYTNPVLVGSKAENYEIKISPASGTLSVIIAKADVAGITFPVDGQVEFGFDLRYATFKIDGVGDGTFAFEDAKNITPPELGYYEYKVIFTPTDARNYNTQEAMISLEVVKCQLNYVVGIAGTAQVGQTLAAVTTGLPTVAADYIQYQWYRSDGTKLTAINGATSDHYVATDADVGYTLVVYTFFDPATPYVYHENANTVTVDNGVTFGIIGEAKEAIKEVTLTFWQRLMDWLYRIIAVITGVQLGGGLF